MTMIGSNPFDKFPQPGTVGPAAPKPSPTQEPCPPPAPPPADAGNSIKDVLDKIRDFLPCPEDFDPGDFKMPDISPDDLNPPAEKEEGDTSITPEDREAIKDALEDITKDGPEDPCEPPQIYQCTAEIDPENPQPPEIYQCVANSGDDPPQIYQCVSRNGG